MIARAGGLDQGNIVPNLDDISKHGDIRNYLLLAGSAINGFLDKSGNPDPRGGAEAMKQALTAFRDPAFDNSQESIFRVFVNMQAGTVTPSFSVLLINGMGQNKD